MKTEILSNLKWLPFAALALMAMAFEPIRSGFTIDNQTCELLTDWDRVRNSVFNLRHVLSFGILFIVAAATLRQNRIVIAAISVFLFSILLEFEQSFFATGHCRAWDLIPNIIGIGLAVVVYATVSNWTERR